MFCPQRFKGRSASTAPSKPRRRVRAEARFQAIFTAVTAEALPISLRMAGRKNRHSGSPHLVSFCLDIPGGVYCRRVAAFQKYSFLVVPSPGDSKVGPTDS